MFVIDLTDQDTARLSKKSRFFGTHCAKHLLDPDTLRYPYAVLTNLVMVFDWVTLSEGALSIAIQNSEQGVQAVEHPSLSELLSKANWSDLHVFRGVAEAPSMRRAAQDLGVSVNTVRARIARLEASLGTTLFARRHDGLHVTKDGLEVLRVVEDMRFASEKLEHGHGNNVLVRDGEIRICASEGIGTFWLTPRLPDLKALLPHLLVSLDSFSDQSRIRARDFDISVGFERPNDQEAIVSKLATLHFMPFASDHYIRTHGLPLSLDEMDGHQCVQQHAPGLNYDSMRFFFSTEMMKRLVSIRVSSSYSLYWAVASGVGIGALPTYMRAISRKVQPIDLPIRMKFELWMSYSHAARSSVPVRQAVNWLRSCFDPVRYPWFSDRFVHPDDFVSPHDDSKVISFIDHIVDDLG